MTDTTDQRTRPRRKKIPANVIRVDFARGGGRVIEPIPPPPSTSMLDDRATPRWHRSEGAGEARCEPVTDVFSKREVAKLLGLTEARLRTLDRAQIVSPSGARNGKRAYTFQDLIA